MNRSHTVLIVLALLLVCAGSAQADVIDPVIIVRGGSGTIHLTNLDPVLINLGGTAGCQSGTWSVPGSDPTAFVNGLPFLSCVFANNLPSQIPITSLTFHISPQNQALTLFNQPWPGQESSWFTQTSIQPNFAAAIFSLGALPYGREFEVVFIGFSAGTTVTQVAGVPEPGTLALLGTSLLAVASKLRKKKKV